MMKQYKVNKGLVISFLVACAVSLAFAFLLFGCSIEQHLAKAQKHIDIAKRKGAIIKPDTVWQYQYSTITVFDTITNSYKEILKKDSTVNTINNTISAGMTRQERKALDDYYKHMEKMMKLQNDSLGKELKALIRINNANQKTERVIVRQENKGGGWIWYIIPWVIVAFLIFRKYIFKMLTRI